MEKDAVSTIINVKNKHFLAFTTFYHIQSNSQIDKYMAQLFQAMIHYKIVTDSDAYMITCNILPHDGKIHMSACMREGCNIEINSTNMVARAHTILSTRDSDICDMFKFMLEDDQKYYYFGKHEMTDEIKLTINTMEKKFADIKNIEADITYGGSITKKQDT